MAKKRKELEHDLHKSLKELKDIKWALDVASIVAITDQSGKIIYANDKFCEISKYSREELLGQDHRIINSAFHSKDYIRDLWHTIAQGKVWKGEFRNKAKDGSFYWVDTTIIPFLNERGKPYQYVSIRNEITKRKDMEEEIKLLPQRIIAAQESEQQRISREIHDDLGQSLAILKMTVQSLIHKSASGEIDKTGHKQVVGQINNAIEKTRTLSARLRPSTLEVLGVATTIKALLNDFSKTKDIKLKGKLIALDNFVFQGEVINLFRIIQEALTNIINHAQANVVEVTMTHRDGWLRILIKDNGNGFKEIPRADMRNPARGLGFLTMRERANLLKGSLEITSKRGVGTIVSLTIPVSLKDGVMNV